MVLSIPFKKVKPVTGWIHKQRLSLLVACLSLLSIGSFVYFYQTGVGLAYNDARSHLDISRRVVEGLKPGLAQLGSVWLPLPHILMLPTIWNDFMWHSGLSGALVSMVAYVATGMCIYFFLQYLQVGMVGRLVGVFIFGLNLNILYLQSTAMTELLLLAAMTLAAYHLVRWADSDALLDLLKAAFWVMLSTVVRYDGWFLFICAVLLIVVHVYRRYGIKAVEGVVIFFSTLGAVGIFMWFLWNQLIFKDALYFAFGPFSARAQQEVLEAAGELQTKGKLGLSIQHYVHAFFYNTGTFTSILGILGAIYLWFDQRVSKHARIMSMVLLAPFVFNVLALYLGHSVLYVQGLSGDTWFNVRYGIMMMPTLAIFVGLLVDRLRLLRGVLVGLLVFILVFSFTSFDAVTIDDALAGKSQKNVTEIAGWLKQHVTHQEGFILVSAASHDAVIFSSDLPMRRFIHEGTGQYWEQAIAHPASWARWIIMRTGDTYDLTQSKLWGHPDMEKYELVDKYPFADIYQLKPEYWGATITKPILSKQK